MDIKIAKILNTILFFANKSDGNTIERLKLMKLLWLADRIHLMSYGRFILKDTYSALPLGPVPSDAMDLSKKPVVDYYSVDKHLIKALSESNTDYFSKSDLKVLNFVWENYGHLSGFRLKDISHGFPEWIRFKVELEDKSCPRSYLMDIEDFFQIPDEAFFKGFVNSEKAKASQKLFHTHTAIQSQLNKNV